MLAFFMNDAAQEVVGTVVLNPEADKILTGHCLRAVYVPKADFGKIA